MTLAEQTRMVTLLTGNMREVHLSSLKPLLNSTNETVALGAFNLLTELALTREIKQIHLSLSQNNFAK